jgi:putative Mn2+ efflux pump MntP
MSFSITQHLDALLLALASSTDNFTVGMSVGVGRKRLPFWVNAMISACNAMGALVASYSGVLLSQTLSPLLAPLLAAGAFGILALLELQQSSWYSSSSPSETSANKHQFLDFSQVLRLALPMTLNNLAGGVAGGAAGLSPMVTAIYALVASFVTMAVGHWIGQRLGSMTRMDPSLISACLLTVLCLLTLHETFL